MAARRRRPSPPLRLRSAVSTSPSQRCSLTASSWRVRPLRYRSSHVRRAGLPCPPPRLLRPLDDDRRWLRSPPCFSRRSTPLQRRTQAPLRLAARTVSSSVVETAARAALLQLSSPPLLLPQLTSCPPSASPPSTAPQQSSPPFARLLIVSSPALSCAVHPRGGQPLHRGRRRA